MSSKRVDEIPLQKPFKYCRKQGRSDNLRVRFEISEAQRLFSEHVRCTVDIAKRLFSQVDPSDAVIRALPVRSDPVQHARDALISGLGESVDLGAIDTTEVERASNSFYVAVWFLG